MKRLIVLCVILWASMSYAQYNVAPPACGNGTAPHWDGATWSCDTINEAGSIIISRTVCPTGYVELAQLGNSLLITTGGQVNGVGTFNELGVIPAPNTGLTGVLGQKVALVSRQVLPVSILANKIPTTFKILLCEKS